jgi:hypothetical protein
MVFVADPAFGRGPPAGAGGPPPGVTVGPPAAAHVSEASAASMLGGLNAAHANTNAFANANPNSMVGDIATYEQQMGSALALTDPKDQANAITAARQQLALSTNKTLTASAVTRLDQMLGIKGADPTLGTSP